MNICYNCFYNFDGSTTCPYCGYDPAMDNGKYRNAMPLGSVLSSKYIIGRVIGHSVYGYTYIAEDDNSDKKVVVKEYLPDALASRAAENKVVPGSGENGENFEFGKKQFNEEAKTLGRHKTDPCIVKVSPAFAENGTSYYIVDFVKGKNLVEYMQEKGGRLSWEETENIFMPIIENVSAIQSQSVIHTEIVPENIMITPDGKVKLLGFGSARIGLTKKLCGKKSSFADAYSIAAAMYYAITGAVVPDQTERKKNDRIALPSQLGAVLPQGKEAAIMYALGPDSEYRYQSLDAFRKDLLTLTEAPNVKPVPQKAQKAQKPQKAAKGAPKAAPAPVPTPAPAPTPAAQQPAQAPAQRPMPQQQAQQRPMPQQQAQRPMPQQAQRPAQAAPQGGQKKGFPKFIIPVALIAVVVVGIIIATSNNNGNNVQTSEGTTTTTVAAVQNTASDSGEPQSADTSASEEETSAFATTSAGDSSDTTTSRTSRTRRTRDSDESGEPEEGDPTEEETTEEITTAAPMVVAPVVVTTTTAYTTPEETTVPATTAATTARTTKAVTTTVAEKIDFEYKTENGGLTLTKYTGSSKNVEIPQQIKGKTVKALAKNLFRSSDIKTVTIPLGVTEIGEEAFAMCKSLTTVTMSDSVTTLGSDTFRGCSALKTLNLSSGIVIIPPRMCRDCTSLGSITIPDSVVFIDSYAFSGCTSLTRVTIPASVTYITGGSFDSCINMARATFKGTGTEISSGVFTNCPKLTVWAPQGGAMVDMAQRDGLTVKFL